MEFPISRWEFPVSLVFSLLRIRFPIPLFSYSVDTELLISVNMHIRKINNIRRDFSNTAVRTLVQSIVIARLDYRNSVCVGFPMNRLQRFQLVQNNAARVISQTKRYTSIVCLFVCKFILPGCGVLDQF